jgi:hypothetical protein
MRKVAKFLAIMIATALLAGVVHGTVKTSDRGDDSFKTLNLDFTGEAISMLLIDTNVNTSAGVKLYDFPAGQVIIHGAVLKNAIVTVTAANGITASTQGDISVGSTQATGTNLTGTAVNIIAMTTKNTMTNETSAYLTDDAMIDGSSTAADIWVNLLIDTDAASAIHTNAMTVAGELQIIYSELLDY